MNSISTDMSPEISAEELVREVFPLINNLSCGKPIYDSPLFITPFHIVQYIENNCFTFLHPTMAGQTNALFFTPSDSNKEEFMLTVVDGQEVYRLQNKTLIQQTDLFGAPCPWFDFCWKLENDCDRFGNLTYLHIDVTSDIYAEYSLEEDYRKKVGRDEDRASQLDAESACEHLPKNLRDITSICGRLIPHIIFFQERVEEIIKLSHLIPFLSTCRSKAV